MAIFGLSNETGIQIENKQQDSIIPLYSSEHVDNALVSTIPGFRWEVTYFHRNITEYNLVTQYDPELDPTLQEFTRINDFIIKVDTAIPTGMDPTGSGVVDGGFIPNPNDIFITKIPDGKSVIYVITNIERLSYNMEDIFKIEYSLYGEIKTPDDPILAKLMGATSETLIYNPEFRATHTKPMYDEVEFKTREDLTLYMDRMLSDWNNSFINIEHTYYVSYTGTDGKIIVDTYLSDFIREVVGLNNLSSKIELIDMEDNKVSILNYILKDKTIVNRVYPYMGYINPTEFGTNPYLYSLTYTGISKLVSISNIEDDTISTRRDVISEYYPYVDDKNYIFRKPVYDVINGLDISVIIEDLTLFEKVVLATVTGVMVDIDDMVTLHKHVYSLPDREKFYFIPILIYMMKYYLTTFTIKFV